MPTTNMPVQGQASSMFLNLKVPKNLIKYNLMRGATDFSNLAQWDLYETGYSFLIPISYPTFLVKQAQVDPGFYDLFESYKRIMEYEFRGLDGLDNITSETGQITNGISEINIINKVNRPAGNTVSMRYFEKSGLTISKVHEAFLRGVKDPMTQVKRYNGLITDGTLEPGYENECFTYLYIVTDNTVMNLERAFLLTNCQPTNVDFSVYTFDKGSIEFKEISVEMNTFAITGNDIDFYAKKFLERMNNTADSYFFQANSYDFAYKGIEALAARSEEAANYGSTTTSVAAQN